MSMSDKAPGEVRDEVTQQDGQWALVTGATGGLGMEFSRWLARHGCRLVVTGRDTARLAALESELRGMGAEVKALPLDLGDRPAREQLLQQLADECITVTTLVNNAGFGIIGPVAENDVDRLLTMVEVDVTALTHLTRLFLPGMLAAGQGSIINVGSTAAYQPIPEMAAYAAAKAYVRSFTTALWHETRGTGVRVTCINPGPTETGFFAAAGDENALRDRRTPGQVVDAAFEALRKGRPSVVDGPKNAAMAFANRFAPTSVSATIAKAVLKH